MQIWTFTVILASMPFYFFSLDLPKRIINGPIQGRGFHSAEDTQTFLQIALPLSAKWLGHPVVLFSGFELSRLSLLFALSISYALLVVINGWFKLYLNTFVGRTGERVLRRLRYEMVDRVLRFPVSRARQLRPSEIAEIIKDEVDPLSDFIGDSYSVPLFLGGQGATALAFLYIQNLYFGLITSVIVSFQAWLVPRLRRRLLELGKQRQMTARSMAGRIGEIIQGIDDVHVNDTSNLVRAEISNRLGDIFFIRLELFKRKFSVKFINNLLMQFLSILFYLIGGYFVVVGRLDIGTLVASIAAYKDLPGPVKGLIDWDQQRLMAQVRYTHAIEVFSRDDLMPAALQDSGSEPRRISQGFDLRDLAVKDGGAVALVESATAHLDARNAIALVAEPAEAVSRLLELLARLVHPTGGRVALDGVDLGALPESVTGRSIGYVDANTFLPGGSIFGVLTEVLKNRPIRPAPNMRHGRITAAMRAQESILAGNSNLDYLADWTDRERISAASDADILEHIIAVMRLVGLEDDIRKIGLNSLVGPDAEKRLSAHIAEARSRLQDRLSADGVAKLIEPFDNSRFNTRATIAENIIFGMPAVPSFEARALPANPIFRTLLTETGLLEILPPIGLNIARTFIEMFAELPSTTTLFDAAVGLTPEQLEKLRRIVTRVDASGLESLAPEERDELLALSLDYAEPRYRFGVMNGDVAKKVLEMRHRLQQSVASIVPSPIIRHEFKVLQPFTVGRRQHPVWAHRYEPRGRACPDHGRGPGCPVGDGAVRSGVRGRACVRHWHRRKSSFGGAASETSAGACSHEEAGHTYSQSSIGCIARRGAAYNPQRVAGPRSSHAEPAHGYPVRPGGSGACSIVRACNLAQARSNRERWAAAASSSKRVTQRRVKVSGEGHK